MNGLTRVSIGLESTREEIEAVERVFKAVDVHVLVDPEIARYSEDSPWVMYLTAPLARLASQFNGTTGQGPEASWPGIRRFLDLVSGAYGGRPGSMVFTDEGSDVIIALTPELSDQAYAEVLQLDLMEIEGKRISWDEEIGGWHTLGGDPCPKR